MSAKMSTQSYLKGYGNINIDHVNREYEKTRETKRKSYQKKKVANSHLEKRTKRELKIEERKRLLDEYRRVRFDYKLEHDQSFQVCLPYPDCVNSLLTVYNKRPIDPLNEISFVIKSKSLLIIKVYIPNKKVTINVHYDLDLLTPISFTVKDKQTDKIFNCKINDENILLNIEAYMTRISSRGMIYKGV